MALRIAVYTGLLYQGLVKSGAVKVGNKLPPVFPLVIYNGKSPWKAPLKLSDLIAVPHSELARFQLNQEYFVIDEQRISPLLLDKAKGEASYIFRLERAKDIQCVAAIFKEIKERLRDKKFDFLRKAIENWFSRVLVEKKIITPRQWAELIREEDMLAEKFDEWKEEFIEEGRARGRIEGKAEGRIEGLARGRMEGKAEGRIEGKAEGRIEGLAEGKIEGREEVILTQKTTLLEILAQRFGKIPDYWKEKITCLSDPSVISRLTISVITANSPEEYEKLLYKKAQN